MSNLSKLVENLVKNLQPNTSIGTTTVFDVRGKRGELSKNLHKTRGGSKTETYIYRGEAVRDLG